MSIALTETPPPTDIPLDHTGLDEGDRVRVRTIRRAAHRRSNELRAEHRLLRHQDAVGASLLAVSVLGFVGSGALYLGGVTPWYVTVIVSALFAAVAHELEHDLIHRLYFAHRPVPHNLMMALVWAIRPYTISPWGRRPMHLNHHAVSGSADDIEEVAITNGKPWGLVRVFSLVDPYTPSFVRILRGRTEQDRAWRPVIVKAAIPFTPIAIGTWYGFLGCGAYQLAGGRVAPWLWTTLTTLLVVWVGPNVWRSFCLHLISSNMHYFGDIEPGNVLQQTQVLNRWWLVPFQLFCLNFGSTHSIHHFYVADPFYVRQLTAAAVHPVMAANGVRFNDLGSFRRANRWQ